jgi:hypothetical protein
VDFETKNQTDTMQVMRSKSLVGIIVGLLVLCGEVVGLKAQTTNIFGYTNVWKFNPDGLDLGTEWRASNYDDSPWNSGPGVFSTDAEPLPAGTIGTFLNVDGPFGYVTNFYFRTQFTFTGSTNNVVLVFQNLIDDGAVFYLNGAELRRVAMPPTGPITHFTFATRQDDVSAHGIDVFQVAPTNLISGVNTLAVEVHQGGVGSSDIVFGTDLEFYKAAPTITRQPTNQLILCAGPPVTFSVATTGGGLRYQWYSNNVAITPLTNASFTIPVTRTNQNGAVFYVVVSNLVGRVQSSNAVLNVYPDACGPRLLSAAARDTLGFSNQVDIVYDESVAQASGIAATNYTVTISNQPTSSINVTSVLGGGSTYILRLDQNIVRTNMYIVTVNNVRDLASNVIAPNSQVAVRYRTNIFEFGSNWRYNDSESDDSLGRDWLAFNYNDDPNAAPFHWGEANGIFWNDQQNPIAPCGNIGSSLTLQVPTIYFRKKFVLPTNYNDITAELGHIYDEGVIIYINGTEIFRSPSMPAGTPNFSTRPTSCPEARCATNTIRIPDGVLLRGTNLIAAELHQCTPASEAADPDAVFDCSLTLSAPIGPTLRRPPAPQLLTNWVTQAGSVGVLSWQTNGLGTNNGYILQFTDNLGTNLWREVQPDMANPYTIPQGATQRFYRLCWEP